MIYETAPEADPVDTAGANTEANKIVASVKNGILGSLKELAEKAALAVSGVAQDFLIWIILVLLLLILLYLVKRERDRRIYLHDRQKKFAMKTAVSF